MVDKITRPITPLGEINKINEIIDAIPTVPLEGVQINNTDLTITNKKVNIATNSAYNSTSNKIATMSDVPDISGLASDSSVVHNTGNETISGVKDFNDQIYVKNSTTQGYEPVLTYPNATNTYATKRLGNVPSDVTSIPPTTLYNFDGQWNYTFNQIHSALNLGTYTYYLNATKGQEAGASSSNIFDILPDDDYKYELLIMASGRTKATTASHINIATTAWANPLDTDHNVIAMRGDGSHSLYNNNSLVIPIDTDRKIQVSITNSKADLVNVTIFGYRRIGTNL